VSIGDLRLELLAPSKSSLPWIEQNTHFGYGTGGKFYALKNNSSKIAYLRKEQMQENPVK